MILERGPWFWLLAILSLLGLFFGGGCSNSLTVAEKVSIWKETTAFMKENRIAGQVSLSASGDGSVYAKQSFGLDTGLELHVSAQLNATEGKAVETEPTQQDQ